METVAIVAENDNHGGYRLINKCDFNPEIHKLFDANEKEETQIALKDRKLKQQKVEE